MSKRTSRIKASHAELQNRMNKGLHCPEADRNSASRRHLPSHSEAWLGESCLGHKFLPAHRHWRLQLDGRCKGLGFRGGGGCVNISVRPRRGGGKLRIHRYTAAPTQGGFGSDRRRVAAIHRYTDTPTQGDPASDRRRIAAINRYTDTPTGGVRQYTDTPTQGGPASDRRRSAAIHRYTDTPTQGNPASAWRRIAAIHRYTDTPTQRDHASDRRRIAAIHRYTDPGAQGGPRERSAQDCGNTPIHRYTDAGGPASEALHRYTDPGGPASDRRRIAVIHRYTDPASVHPRSSRVIGSSVFKIRGAPSVQGSILGVHG